LESPDLHALLKKHWGYSEFRPKQEAIVRAILDGRDTAVVMPTGGGKSLCYQLPAAAMEQTCVVVSPLIALMQDQAAGLREIGIEAAFLNSTQDASALREVHSRAEQGKLRLLYLSPERMVRGDLLDWLDRIPLGFFAIDEAHCISEWGHEFRPEYRQLRILRERFPDVPIAAFTASATQQVRHDILHQLHLHEPAKFVMSFHRPNLRYVIHETKASDQDRLLAAALRFYDEGNVIVYAPTIKGVESTASWLTSQGFPAVPYHGQMPAAARQQNQEIWMTGEKRILVGTIAFGLGINKPDVRAVIHLSLPKSVEQYYQEAGRAGRDGEQADCVMLWQKRDIGLLTYFIEQIQDSAEKERAWQRYHVMRRFVESNQCRHRQICAHFGEIPKWESCDACDVCGTEIEWLDVETAPEAVARPSAKKAVARKAAAGAGPSGRDSGSVKAAAAAALPIDTELRERLKTWRLEIAQKRKVPAFVILHDTTIDALCRQRPRNLSELLEVNGIGEKKAEKFGEQILKLIHE
jgi:ATP-dependent DNA helicase RecQ